MAKDSVVILLGGPKDGMRYALSQYSRDDCLEFSQIDPVQYMGSYADLAGEKLAVRRVTYNILPRGYAPYPDDPSQVYRLGLLQGLDPVTELLKLLLKGNQHG